MHYLSSQGLFILFFFFTLIGGGLAADAGWNTTKICFWVISFWSFIGIFVTSDDSQK